MNVFLMARFGNDNVPRASLAEDNGMPLDMLYFQ